MLRENNIKIQLHNNSKIVMPSSSPPPPVVHETTNRVISLGTGVDHISTACLFYTPRGVLREHFSPDYYYYYFLQRTAAARRRIQILYSKRARRLGEKRTKRKKCPSNNLSSSVAKWNDALRRVYRALVSSENGYGAAQ